MTALGRGLGMEPRGFLFFCLVLLLLGVLMLFASLAS